MRDDMLPGVGKWAKYNIIYLIDHQNKSNVSLQ